MIFSGFHECVGCTPHLPHEGVPARTNVLAEEEKKNQTNHRKQTKVMKMATNELENHAGANIENNGICAFRRDGKG